MRRLILAGLPAILTACGTATVTENRTTSTTVEPTVIETPAPAEPLPTASASPLATAIPAALHGRWGLVPADCTSTRGDAKGLIEITDKQIKFYESRATLATVAESADTRLVADFAFSGEGQTWQRRMTLEAQDEGRTLVRSETGADALPEPLRYQKCAG